MPTPSFRGGPAKARMPKKLQPSSGQLSAKTMVGSASRHRILRDSIQGITRPDIRRLARRGGVKRISAGIYNEVRSALRDRLSAILRSCAIYVEYRNAKTITTSDVIHSLRRLGRPIYGFDPTTYDSRRKLRAFPAPN